MSLFRRNGTSLIFVLLRVYEEELEPLKKMIIENGGAISKNDNNMGIIFTQACNYSKLIWPDKNQNLIYDIQFIKKCVRKGKIVDPAPYKLSSISYFDCAMMHFLYGGCKCSCTGTNSSAVLSLTESNRQAVFRTQSQTSSITEDIFCTPVEEMSVSLAAIDTPTGNTQDPLSSPLGLERSVKRERTSSGDLGSPNCTATVKININVLMPDQNSDESNTSSITGSSNVVNQQRAINGPIQLSSGDDRPTEALNELEKRPCSFEHHTQGEPKLQVLARRRNDMESSLGLTLKKRQQRTPTTLTDTHDTPNAVSTPEGKTSNVDDVTRSGPFGENGSSNLSDITDDTSVSYVVKIESPGSPTRSDASTIVIKPQSLSQLSRKRRHSEAEMTETPPEFNVIVPDDASMHSTINQPVASSAKKNSSLVINKYHKNYKQALKFSTKTKPGSKKSKYFKKSNINSSISSSSDLSEDDDVMLAEIPITPEKACVRNSEREILASKTALDDENKPGPSGVGKHPRMSMEAVQLCDSDSSNDEISHSSAKKNGQMKKPIKQSKQATKTWSRKRDTCISSDNDSDPSLSSHESHGADVHSEARVTRSKTRNRDIRISSDNDSDTSSSSHAPARAKMAVSSESRESESGYRTWFDNRERRQMIQYIIDKEAFSLCSDRSFFESMANKKIFRHRSATSLYAEFRKILRNIDEYAVLFKLTASTIRQFKKLK